VITKGERAELRSIVRQQFKVLRNEIEQREIEMVADVEDQIAAKYSDQDQGWSALMHEVHEATMEANRRINNALYDAGYQTKGRTERLWVQTPNIAQPKEERQTLRHHALTKIRAEVHAAKLKLDRDEADLLRNLAVGALESDEARSFLTAIPSVGELVPAVRLRELEASLKDEGEGQ
jgi:hypothetical protein